MTQETILEECLAMLSTEGLHKLSISALANRLCCSKSSIYYHFKSKKQMISMLYKQTFFEIYDKILINDDLERSLVKMYSLIYKEKEKMIFLLKYRVYDICIDSDKQEIMEFLAEVERKITILAEDNYFKIKDIVVLRAMLFGPIWNIIFDYKKSNIECNQQQIENIAKLVATSIKGEK